MAERRNCGSTDPKLDFLNYNDLVCEAVGGKVIFATDEWFAPAANLLKTSPPQFVVDAFTNFGKWMDGWETRRKRTPGLIHGLDVDTSFFTGNYAPYISIQATCLDQAPTFVVGGDRTGMAASQQELAAVTTLHSEAWPELLGVSSLKPGYKDVCHNYFTVSFKNRVTHLRVNLYPDGGVSRLRVYGVGVRDWTTVSPDQDLDLMALTNGGVCLSYSDAHFGHPRNIIGPGQAASMADGWETARRLDRPRILRPDQQGILQVPGWEWAVFRLGFPGVISRVELDTSHFKGNAPDSCRLEASSMSPEDEAQALRTEWNSVKWEVLMPPQKLRPHHVHAYTDTELTLKQPVSHIRLIIAPDGGVSRLRLWGRPVLETTAAARRMALLSKL
ncbi:allantoicase isoform X2 [Cynoglossus semilaevis]|uniref:allantoicase isoform X2 n=1 Tax=Cynoglossus semilaevis TaxID=244447 RepID=UPI0007DCAC6E|nr:probable allantoicase isoform X2 [Cynoglossus semilaevis]